MEESEVNRLGKSGSDLDGRGAWWDKKLVEIARVATGLPKLSHGYEPPRAAYVLVDKFEFFGSFDPHGNVILGIHKSPFPMAMLLTIIRTANLTKELFVCADQRHFVQLCVKWH